MFVFKIHFSDPNFILSPSVFSHFSPSKNRFCFSETKNLQKKCLFVSQKQTGFSDSCHNPPHDCDNIADERRAGAEHGAPRPERGRPRPILLGVAGKCGMVLPDTEAYLDCG